MFGTVVYEDASTATRHYVHLNEIGLDIMDYITPGNCTEEAFRTMWSEFEWENKVAISTAHNELAAFLEHIVSATNMRSVCGFRPVRVSEGYDHQRNEPPPDHRSCLTPHPTRKGESAFLAANLYAKSVFGEDALVNLSVERRDDGKLCGYVRIRSKSQGIALSLGDHVTGKMASA